MPEAVGSEAVVETLLEVAGVAALILAIILAGWFP